jgi:hypothetical protein
MRAVSPDLKRNPRELHTTNRPALGEQRRHLGGEAADLTAEDEWKHLRLAVVGALVDEEAGGSLDLRTKLSPSRLMFP